jgi:hypothetical protein
MRALCYVGWRLETICRYGRQHVNLTDTYKDLGGVFLCVYISLGGG